MALYKKLAAAETLERLAEAARETADRFGAPPPEFERLLALSRLRLVAGELGVKTLQRRGDELGVTLDGSHRLDPERLLSSLRQGRLQASSPDAFRSPGLFGSLPPGSVETIPRTGRLLMELARPGALRDKGLDGFELFFAREGAPS